MPAADSRLLWLHDSRAEASHGELFPAVRGERRRHVKRGSHADAAKEERASDGFDLHGILHTSPSQVLLRLLGRLPESIEGDGFGLIYEYFLGQFAFSEGQKGGEFFTPTSIVKLIVEIIEQEGIGYHGQIWFDFFEILLKRLAYANQS